MLFERCSSALCSFLGSDNVTLYVSWLSYLWSCRDVTLCWVLLSIPRGVLTLCYRVIGITDLTFTLRHYVALNDQLDVTLRYCVTVGVETVLT